MNVQTFLKEIIIRSFNKSCAWLKGFIYLKPHFALWIFIFFLSLFFNRAHAADSNYDYTQYPTYNPAPNSVIAWWIIYDSNSWVIMNLSNRAWRNQDYLSENYNDYEIDSDNTYRYFMSIRQYQCAPYPSNYYKKDWVIFRSLKNNSIFSQRTDIIKSNNVITENVDTCQYTPASIYFQWDGWFNDVWAIVWWEFFYLLWTWNWIPGTFAWLISKKNPDTWSTNLVISSSSQSWVDWYYWMFHCWFTSCDTLSIRRIKQNNKNVNCFPVISSARYTWTNTTSYNTSILCPKTSWNHKIYWFNNSTQILWSTLIYNNTWTTEWSWTLETCYNNKVYSMTSRWIVSTSSSTLWWSPAINTNIDCNSLFLDSYGWRWIIYNNIATDSRWVSYWNVSWKTEIIFNKTIVPEFPTTETCSWKTTNTSSSFTPETLSCSFTWSSLTCNGSWGLVSIIASWATNLGSTWTTNLNWNLTLPQSSFIISGTNLDGGNIRNAIRITHTGSMLYDICALQGLPGWGCIGFTSGTNAVQLWQWRGVFTYTNQMYEFPVIKSIEVGKLTYAQLTTTTCTSTDGTTRTFTSTGTFTPGETNSTGSLSSSGGFIPPDISTGNPIFDIILEKIKAPIVDVVNSWIWPIMPNASWVSALFIPFNTTTPNLSAMLPAFTISSNTSTAYISVDISKKSWTMLLPADYERQLTSQWFKKPFEWTGWENTAVVANLIAFVFAMLFSMVYIAMAGIFIAPIMIIKRLVDSLGEPLDILKKSEWNIASAGIKILQITSTILIFGSIVGLTISYSVPVLSVILDYMKLFASFMMSVIGAYTVFAVTTNTIVILIPSAAATLLIYRIIIQNMKVS